ncbi:unnamed protein product [Somion occarium]
MATLEASSRFSNLLEAEAQEWLEEETRRTAEYLSFLRGLRNSLAPIHRLPAELLASIFTEATLGEHLKPFDLVVQMSHVCRHWREVLLEMSTAWSDIDVSCIDRARTFVERSNVPGLKLRWNTPSNNSEQTTVPQILDVIISHLSRFTEIRADLNWDNIKALLDLLSTHNAPALRHLGLKLSWHHRQIGMGCKPTPCTASLQLHSLSLCGFAIDWNSPMYSGLKRLELDDQCNFHAVPSVEFLDILERCPDLVHLQVKFSGSTFRVRNTDATTYLAPRRTVELKKCNYFSLDSFESQDCAYVLAHLCLPESTRIHLQKTCRRVTHNEFQQILPKDSAHVNALQAARQLSLSCLPYSDCCMRAMDDSGDSILTIHLQDIIERVANVKPALEILVDAAAIFANVPIEEFSYSSVTMDIAQPDEWLDIFRSFPDVKTLHFTCVRTEYGYNGRINDLLSGLILCTRNTPPILPALSTINFEEVDIHDRTIELFQQLVTSRIEIGFQHNYLEFIGCHCHSPTCTLDEFLDTLEELGRC